MIMLRAKERELYQQGWADCEAAIMSVATEEQRNKIDAWFYQARKQMKN